MATATRLIVVGASAGGLSPLTALLRGLDPTLPAGISVVVHQPEGRMSALADILDHAGPLPASVAEDGQLIESGHVHVAHAGFHLLCDGPRLRLSRGLLEHGFRPAIDPLFRTAAASFGASTVAVVLSGSLDDGSQGAHAVRMAGGRVVVQDPADATYPDMPMHALEAVGTDDVDAVAPTAHLSGTVAALVGDLPDVAHADARSIDDPSAPDIRSDPTSESHGETSADHPELTCPSCSGPLRELPPGDHFRCRLGHGWSLETLAAGHGESLEASLWAAIRLLEERAGLLRRRLGRARSAERARAAERLARELATVNEHARRLRTTIADIGAADVRTRSTDEEPRTSGQTASGGDAHRAAT